MPSKKAKIAQLRSELDELVTEYVENFDTYTDQESKYFIQNIQDKQKEIWKEEKRGSKNEK